MIDEKIITALAPLPRAGSVTPPSDIHALADEYERWLSLQQLTQRVFEDPLRSNDRLLARKAYAIGQAAESKLTELRAQLGKLPSQDLNDLARKARVVRFDASSWLDEASDPLFISLTTDSLALAGTEPLPEPFPIADEIFQRLEALELDAEPLPWEDQL